MTSELTELIARARVVVWDFDGPVCRLFAGYTAQRVAAGLMAWLEQRGLRDLLTDTERDTVDPQAVVRAVDRRHPGSDLVAAVDEWLAQEELRAVSSAMPTAYADPLIRTWTALGVRMAIATGHSPRAVTGYLDGRGLTECFAPRIYGRDRLFDGLKPDPHHLSRALHATGTAPDAVLALGDSPLDLAAAQAAGVPFLGYARHEDTEQRLRAAGAPVVVRSLESVLSVLRTPVRPN
ncbi:HAD family hydrolase [Streptomyces cellostaticus]|uniref:HAD family hydrolase n=1 Tax=Streptomyces cellostaticus TaxID=67285 RepID=A0A101NG60_9ACTN|nr:HAD family hydrolase [Streptomyces cellostaticus]KUM92683.1 HAD family hydrolase [Streptomyces cellostaticus]GHI06715.1 hydrolase [Streptomyces cellostaticus]